MHDLIPLPPPGDLLTAFDAVLDLANQYASREKAESTRAAYAADWDAFRAWCGGFGLCPLPATPDAVRAHLAALAEAGKSPSTIGRRTSAIKHAHELAGFETPTKAKAVKVTLSGIRRMAVANGYVSRRKAAATADIVRAMLATCTDGMTGTRDRALLAFGFASAMRRSELVALRVADLTEQPDGIRVLIARSKTDQEGEGQTIVIPRGAKIRPVEALQTWLQAAGISEGPVFRRVHRYGAVRAEGLTDHMVARIVKGRCRRAGLDPALYSGHSLRAGFLTSAAEAGASVFKMMEVSRHRSVDVLSGYVRSANLFVDHAGAAFL
jgi:site-specific recombinase XerD